VTVAGIFSGENVTAELLNEFCRTAGPTILFPYVREIVHKLTADGAYGPIRLDPINVQAALATAEWGDVNGDPSAPTEP
jgi:preprotein translocase subunit SecB